MTSPLSQRDPAEAARGRVTAVVGAAEVEPANVAPREQTYRVSTGGGATLVFRDLYWPGYRASLDGRELPVEPLADTLVAVRLPAGADGELSVEYDPLPVAVLTGFLTLGGGLVLAAAALTRTRPRS